MARVDQILGAHAEDFIFFFFMSSIYLNFLWILKKNKIFGRIFLNLTGKISFFLEQIISWIHKFLVTALTTSWKAGYHRRPGKFNSNFSGSAICMKNTIGIWSFSVYSGGTVEISAKDGYDSRTRSYIYLAKGLFHPRTSEWLWNKKNLKQTRNDATDAATLNNEWKERHTYGESKLTLKWNKIYASLIQHKGDLIMF